MGADTFARLDEADVDRLLAKYAGRIKLVAVPGGANVTGCMPEVRRLAEKAHAMGAQFLVDCAQIEPHRSIEIGALDNPSHLDYVALSARKMYSPFVTGARIGRRNTFDQGERDDCGGGTIAFVGIDSVAWAATPVRDEAGSPNVERRVALAAKTMALRSIGMDMNARQGVYLTAYALKRMVEIDSIHIFGDADPQRTVDRLGVIPFNVGNLSHFLVAAILGGECDWGFQAPDHASAPWARVL